MEYLTSIGWFLTWPLLIAGSYFAVKYALKKFKLFDEEK